MDDRTRLSRRALLKRGIAIGGALAAAPAIAACGTAAIGAAPVDVPKTPRRGGTLRLGFAGGGVSDTLDPIQAVSNTDYYRAFALFDYLYYPNTEFDICPSLAESAEPSADASVWTVRLRPDVEFHDGRRIGADDLAYTLRRIFKVSYSGLAGRFAMVDLKRLRKLDRRTLRIPLHYPFSIFDIDLMRLPLVPVGFDPNHPIGTGAFMFQSFAPGNQSTFVRNPNWWGGIWGAHGTPYVDALQMIDLTDDTARVNALLSGQVHGIDQVPFAEAPALRSTGVVLSSVRCGNWRPFTMRIDVPPFDDVRVRQAMRLIVNREQMVDQALGGYGVVANDVYSVQDPAYRLADLPQRHQDIEQAKFLLKRAGREDPRMTLVTSPIQAGIVEASTVLVSQAALAGVTIKLDQVDPDTFFGPNYLKWPFAVDWWPPTKYLDEVVVSDGPKSTFNECHWRNPRFSKLYYAALRETDSAKRLPLEAEMMRIQHAEGGYVIWGFINTLDAYTPRLQGVIPTKWGQDYSDCEFWRLWLA